MKKLIISVILFLFTGCGVYFCDVRPLDNIPVTNESTISVIYFDRITAGGNIYPVGRLNLGYVENKELKVLNTEDYEFRILNNRLYIFNLPPNKYFILNAFALLQTKIPNVEKDNRIMINTHLTFEKENYLKSPFIVEKNKFNIIGKYTAKRNGFFTTISTLTKKEDMKIAEEREIFHKFFGKKNQWVSFLN